MSKLLKLLVAVSILAVSSISFAMPNKGGSNSERPTSTKAERPFKEGHELREDRREDYRTGDDSAGSASSMEAPEPAAAPESADETIGVKVTF